MSKHTPGPWTAGPTMHGKWHCIFAPSNAGEVARTESAANARLIAAAPELVELLRDIQRNYTATSNGAAFATAYTNRFAEPVGALLARIRGEA